MVVMEHESVEECSRVTQTGASEAAKYNRIKN